MCWGHGPGSGWPLAAGLQHRGALASKASAWGVVRALIAAFRVVGGRSHGFQLLHL